MPRKKIVPRTAPPETSAQLIVRVFMTEPLDSVQALLEVATTIVQQRHVHVRETQVEVRVQAPTDLMDALRRALPQAPPRQPDEPTSAEAAEAAQDIAAPRPRRSYRKRGLPEQASVTPPTDPPDEPLPFPDATVDPEFDEIPTGAI